MAVKCQFVVGNGCSTIYLLYAVLLASLVSCSQHSPPPVVYAWQMQSVLPAQYVVQSEDTLFSIAWHYDLDFADIAKTNNLKEPYTLHTGQKLKIALVRQKNALPKQRKQQSGATFRRKQSLTQSVSWCWPVQTPVQLDFGQRGNKGIDFAGKVGTLVRAAAAGQVVYRGNGLPGYGQLLIIRHANQYLSAYAHNRKIFVVEGQIVKLGAVIAEIGNTGTNRPKLHFEIRYRGKPLNPRKLLPVSNVS